MIGHVQLEMDPSRTTHVELRRGGELVAKIYFSPDYRKIRFVLPELKNFLQTKIDIDRHLIDFTRDPDTAREELKR